MSEGGGPPDVAKVLGGLKDFQRRTVEYIFERLYVGPNQTRRFLLADEVGLGKTLIAKGLIARAVEHLWNKVDRVDIVYICSNAEIARQNIGRLQLPGHKAFELASRITLLPVEVKQLDPRLNFISFTPSTSFDLKSNTGRWEERVLLYHLIREPWSLKGTAPSNVLCATSNIDTFRWRLDDFDPDDVDPKMKEGFWQELTNRVEQERSSGKPTLRDRWNELCEIFAASNSVVRDEDYVKRSRLVGELRNLLAQTCLHALQPDLILLDEFQRFKHLLRTDTDSGLLAHDLFNYSDSTTDAKVLLMSATPYKMYTMHQEAETDDHYADFNRTAEFLLDDSKKHADFQRIVDEYRRSMYRLSEGLTDQHRGLKGRLESFLRKIMVRTERLAVSSDRNGMLEEIVTPPALESKDAASYRSLQNVARMLEQGDTLEYWKSAPYLLSFMDGYELKKAFCERVDEKKSPAALFDALAASSGLALSWTDIEQYQRVDPSNARLRSLMDSVLGGKQWQALWLPPAMPYYEPGGCFANHELQKFTKRLLFSSWKVVPKAVSVLVSFEAERQMMRLLDDAPQNTVEARKKRRPLLRFARSQDRFTGMPNLALIYPSAVLARTCDPLIYLSEAGIGSGKSVVDWAKGKIEVLLSTLDVPKSEDQSVDEAWYWAAPILLDIQSGDTSLRDWLLREDLAAVWSRREDDDGTEPEDEEEGSSSAWEAHLAEARRLPQGRLLLGKPPADLALVLAQVAIGGFGTVATRALARLSGGLATCGDPSLRDGAARIGWSFLSLFNLPETMALLRGLNAQEPYWRRVLEYAVDGNLQATLDEYAHVLKESLGLIEATPKETFDKVADAVSGAVALRTSVLGVEEIKLHSDPKSVEVVPRRMRLRYAARLSDEQGEGDAAARADQVRRAFNSPFWPFVLATTSVGQEGLDFHQYCHAIVHWNLPSNPVDLEQREGRIHRYKGHAVRKNLASRYKGHALGLVNNDLWQEIFVQASKDRAEGETDLIPYWVYPLEGGAKIERHVPALPLSSDQRKLFDLKRSLAVYRMVFGQARQEDLVAYLLEKLPKDAVTKYLDDLRVSLAPLPSEPGATEPWRSMSDL